MLASHASRTAPGIDSRPGRILRDLVELYILSGEPVSSRALAQVNREGLSSASVRAALADLADAGLISHPHQSAGSLPTDEALRFLAGEAAAAASARPDAALARDYGLTLRQETDGDDVGALAQTAARELAQLTRHLAVILLPPLNRIKIRQLELMPCEGRRVLAVLVGDDGQVRHKMVESETLYTASDLSAMAGFLRAHCLGMTLADAREFLHQTLGGDQARYDNLTRQAAVLGGAALALSETGMVHLEGAAGLLARAANGPAPVTGAALADLYRLIEDKTRWLTMLERLSDAEPDTPPGPRALVGDDVGAGVLSEFSLLTAPYFQGETPVGTLALLGPKRMAYARHFAQIGALAAALSGILSSRTERR